MNNLSSYCGLVDAKIRASDKDLPVLCVRDATPSKHLEGGSSSNVVGIVCPPPPPLVGIGLTDLPKTGGGAIALPPYSGISINSKKIDEILLDNAGAKKTGMFHQKGFQLYVLS